MNKEYFLITSYTGGNHAQAKQDHLIKFLGQIRKYFNNSFILLIDGNYIQKIEDLCDLYVFKSENDNIPHGQGDHNQLRIGINILEYYQPKFFYRFNYDYYINDTIFQKINEWKNHIENGKEIVTSQWRVSNDQNNLFTNAIAAGFGCYTLEGAKRLFNYKTITYPWEMQLFSQLKKEFRENEYFIYNSFIEAFGEECFDIFNDGGKTYSQSRLDLIN